MKILDTIPDGMKFNMSLCVALVLAVGGFGVSLGLQGCSHIAIHSIYLLFIACLYKSSLARPYLISAVLVMMHFRE